MAQDKKKNEWLEWIKAILVALILVLILRTFVFSASVVEGESMSPTLEHGNKIIFNKFVYLIGDPERNDVVIIQRPLKNYVKRVIGLPGEVIEIRNHILYIDDEVYEQSYISEEAILNTGNFGPIEVPKDSYFVMGDNRSISKDSRNGLGFIESEHIIGKSEFIIYPFSEWSQTR
ncbi:MAG TPA: signal peptidase I [Candidatus Dormibacteraeota bacterium]|nr:signal peptidase I [Candidatus Dormibacteraeota bacterium]